MESETKTLSQHKSDIKWVFATAFSTIHRANEAINDDSSLFKCIDEYIEITKNMYEYKHFLQSRKIEIEKSILSTTIKQAECSLYNPKEFDLNLLNETIEKATSTSEQFIKDVHQEVVADKDFFGIAERARDRIKARIKELQSKSC